MSTNIDAKVDIETTQVPRRHEGYNVWRASGQETSPWGLRGPERNKKGKQEEGKRKTGGNMGR